MTASQCSLCKCKDVWPYLLLAKAQPAYPHCFSLCPSLCPATPGLLFMLFPLSGMQFPALSTWLTPTHPALNPISISLGETSLTKSDAFLIGSQSNPFSSQ